MAELLLVRTWISYWIQILRTGIVGCVLRLVADYLVGYYFHKSL
jgi:hypothetical protein